VTFFKDDVGTVMLKIYALGPSSGYYMVIVEHAARMAGVTGAADRTERDAF
jgi:hypothetical protein